PLARDARGAIDRDSARVEVACIRVEYELGFALEKWPARLGTALEALVLVEAKQIDLRGCAARLDECRSRHHRTARGELRLIVLVGMDEIEADALFERILVVWDGGDADAAASDAVDHELERRRLGGHGAA